MRSPIGFVLFAIFSASALFAAPKDHVITFGKITTVKLFIGPTEDKTMDMKVRGLYVDGNLKEFTTGESHDVTDRVFVTRKAFRLNDNLPEDSKSPHWKWQRGDWLMVDRTTARITPLKLPEFDPFYSIVTWYRDYAAYCGISDDGDKLYAVVAQIARKKPVLRKELGAASQGDTPYSDCDAPQWERTPSKVTFIPKRYPKVSFTVFGHSTDIATGDEE
jgi:hypothetical protein